MSLIVLQVLHSNLHLKIKTLTQQMKPLCIKCKLNRGFSNNFKNCKLFIDLL